MNDSQKSLSIKSIANRLGFDFCGIAKAVYLDEDARRLESWLNNGMHAGMNYMEKHFDLRVDPAKLVPGAKSVITLLMNYYPSETAKPDAPAIAKYAWGKDYHEVIREKLNDFYATLKEEFGEINGRGFVDSAPVLERTWAQKSGLGWVGKNGNLINKKAGSFFFIASLIVDIVLPYDQPFSTDYCGTCTRCIDNCPTEAILPDKVVDGSKCISYFTIELKEALIPDEMKGKFGNWIFGCDVCQDVCPWNRFSTPTQEKAFNALPAMLDYSFKDWEEISETQFQILFKHSPLKRTKYSGLRRNLEFIKPSS